MSRHTANLYRIQKRDIPRAGVVLADAFQHESVWSLFLRSDASLDQKGTLFESPIKFCHRYGEVYAPSEHLEGIAAWLPGDRADMTIWRLVRSGAIISGIRALRACTDLARKQERIFEPLQVDRRANMKGRSYLYLMVIGVASVLQGQGYGGKLLGALIGESERAGVPIYAETHTERNVGMYERLGFRALKQITLPVIDLPQWELIREPGA
jgi:ribosomal protein S18 acetylase RimI-like enzyme